MPLNKNEFKRGDHTRHYFFENLLDKIKSEVCLEHHRKVSCICLNKTCNLKLIFCCLRCIKQFHIDCPVEDVFEINEFFWLVVPDLGEALTKLKTIDRKMEILNLGFFGTKALEQLILFEQKRLFGIDGAVICKNSADFEIQRENGKIVIRSFKLLKASIFLEKINQVISLPENEFQSQENNLKLSVNEILLEMSQELQLEKQRVFSRIGTKSTESPNQKECLCFADSPIFNFLKKLETKIVERELSNSDKFQSFLLTIDKDRNIDLVSASDFIERLTKMENVIFPQKIENCQSENYETKAEFSNRKKSPCKAENFYHNVGITPLLKQSPEGIGFLENLLVNIEPTPVSYGNDANDSDKNSFFQPLNSSKFESWFPKTETTSLKNEPNNRTPLLDIVTSIYSTPMTAPKTENIGKNSNDFFNRNEPIDSIKNEATAENPANYNEFNKTKNSHFEESVVLNLSKIIEKELNPTSPMNNPRLILTVAEAKPKSIGISFNNQYFSKANVSKMQESNGFVRTVNRHVQVESQLPHMMIPSTSVENTKSCQEIPVRNSVPSKKVDNKSCEELRMDGLPGSLSFKSSESVASDTLFGKSRLLEEKDVQFLISILPKLVSTRLLMNSNKDGGNATVFHNLCDNQSPTVIVARSGVQLAGGFTDQSWAEQKNVWKFSEKSFLFSVNQKKVFKTKDPEKAIRCFPLQGPIFGSCIKRLLDNQLVRLREGRFKRSSYN